MLQGLSAQWQAECPFARSHSAGREYLWKLQSWGRTAEVTAALIFLVRSTAATGWNAS